MHCTFFVVVLSGAASWRNQHRVQSAREDSCTAAAAAAAAACRCVARFSLLPSTLAELCYSVRDVPLGVPESDSQPKHAEAGPAGMLQRWVAHGTRNEGAECALRLERALVCAFACWLA